ncbi:MAG TPA: DUF5130 family protein [Nocardioidaceae bacterium]|nr:DUF5130 family protein [Nocardioidaceae bacterium]
MAGGDTFDDAQRSVVDKAIRDAETMCRLEFSVFVGRSEGETRPFAERLHSTLAAPERSVLLLVDPAARLLEVVTGSQAMRVLNDSEVRLAVLTMQSAFANGDLVGGIAQGVRQLAEHARQPLGRHGT